GPTSTELQESRSARVGKLGPLSRRFSYFQIRVGRRWVEFTFRDIFAAATASNRPRRDATRSSRDRERRVQIACHPTSGCFRKPRHRTLGARLYASQLG